MSQDPIKIQKIVDHFRSCVKAYDSNFQEHTDAFNTDNIGTIRQNKAFHIQAGQFSPVARGQAFTIEDGEVTLKLFFNGLRMPQNELNNSTDVAIKIRQLCMNASRIRGTGIKSVTLSGVTPEPVKTNDNTIVVPLVFLVRTIFDIG